MRVDVYTVNQDTGEQTFSHQCNLTECYSEVEVDELPPLEDVVEKLETGGSIFVGGGAGVLFCIKKAGA